jgi:hypothetical protein
MAKVFGLQTAPLPFASPDINVMQLWHKRFDADKAHEWLRGLVRSICQKDPQR